jgi:hypothetical protein
MKSNDMNGRQRTQQAASDSTTSPSKSIEKASLDWGISKETARWVQEMSDKSIRADRVLPELPR